ncbi:MAG: hypothetical protein ACK5OS_08040 [Chryseotalea sp.]
MTTKASSFNLNIIFPILFIMGMLRADILLAQWKMHGIPAKKTTRIKQVTSPMLLPFWDDFSFDGLPADTLWTEKSSVRIMKDMGNRMPSIGVAVFDGLNALGSPYVTDDLISSGFNDLLISRPLRLQEIPETERANKVYLSVSWQWKGKGEAPDAGDYLQIDFLDNTNTWQSVKVINAIGNPSELQFTTELIPIQSEIFFHNNFQFRIRNYGRRSGAFDTWLIDYVYLNKNRSATDRSFPDRSLGSQPTSFFSEYRAVPASHFKNNITLIGPEIEVQSNNAGFTVLELTTKVYSTYFLNGSVTTLPEVTLENNRNIEEFINFQRKTITLLSLPDENNTDIFPTSYDSLDITLSYTLGSGDNIPIGTDPFADYDPAIYAPIDFRWNDTTSLQYNIRSFYAYDDGEAEYAVSLDQDNYLAAQKFTTLNNKEDTLTSVYIYFPTLAGTLSNLVELSIWNQAGNVPATTPLQQFTILINRTGLNRFQKIKLGTGVLVDPVFYIGWREPQNGTVALGLDKSATTENILFENTNGSWQPVTGISGAIMIRPAFEKADFVTSIPEQEVQPLGYPNPTTNGTLHLPRSTVIVNLLTPYGVTLGYTTQQTESEMLLTLTQSYQGLAILSYKVGKNVYTQKIIFR